MSQHQIVKRACLWIAVALGGAVWGGFAAAQETPTTESIGIKIGAKAPGFKLKDQEGKEIELKTLLEKGKVALVFYRSADW